MTIYRVSYFRKATTVLNSRTIELFFKNKEDAERQLKKIEEAQALLGGEATFAVIDEIKVLL